ncbi:MAG TPA: hypothetical protein VK686_15015, partial [Bryobacteraceae bacterium]|nr:hypothetical protein [Bryobacteraceae bacterium]
MLEHASDAHFQHWIIEFVSAARERQREKHLGLGRSEIHPQKLLFRGSDQAHSGAYCEWRHVAG